MEVLAQFAHDVDYVWPIIRTRAQQSVGLAVLVGSLAGVVTFATAWILIRPRALPADRRGYFKHVGCALLLLVAAVGVQRACQARSDLGYSGMLLRRSSHVGVGRWLVGRAWRKPAAVVSTDQRIARAGQRALQPKRRLCRVKAEHRAAVCALIGKCEALEWQRCKLFGKDLGDNHPVLC